MMLKIDGRLVITNNDREAIGACFASMHDLKYWSVDALKKLYKGIFEMFSDQEYGNLKGKEKAAATRFKNYCADKLYYMPHSREKLLNVIYELILGNEGKGVLRNFGFGNQFGDRLQGNAEIGRISKVKT